MIVIGGAALLFFGPDQLPGVARKVGGVVRELQMTSQAFVRELEHAADDAEAAEAARRATPTDLLSEASSVQELAEHEKIEPAPEPEPAPRELKD
jgi:Sec-independent protein translocase protein TatA